jgi:hypothetical protein
MDFQKLSDLSCVEPTSIEVKGEERLSRITGKVVKIQAKNGEWIPRINEYNAFEYHLPASHGLYVNRQYSKLMKAIQNPEQLGEYCKSHGIKVSVQVVACGITDTYSFPVLHIDKKFVTFLNDLNAEIDFDIYTEPWQKDEEYNKTIAPSSGQVVTKI